LATGNLPADKAREAWARLVTSGAVVVSGSQALTAEKLAALLDQLVVALADFHARFPLRPGLAREELRERLKLASGPFGEILALADDRGLVRQQGPFVRLADHQVHFSGDQEREIARLLAAFETAGVNSPAVREARAAVGDEVYFALVDKGLLVPLGSEVVYACAQYDELRATVVAHLRQHGSLNAAGLRDLLGTSRKYAIAILEHLDEAKVTRRHGDERVLIASYNEERSV
jgi:selenocysteine-specific elongation factor